MSIGKFSQLKARGPLLLIVVLAVLVAGYVVHVNNTKLSAKKLNALTGPDSCQKSMPALQKIKTDPKQPKESEILLSYRIDCYSKSRQYSKALSDAEQLRGFYTDNHNKEKAKEIGIEINALQGAMKRKSANYHSSVKNESVTPEFANELKSENN